jgi:hypothetical protein
MKMLRLHGMILGMVALALVFTFDRAQAQKDLQMKVDPKLAPQVGKPKKAFPPLNISDLQLDVKKHCNVNENRSGDKIYGIKFTRTSGNVMWFTVSLSLDAGHFKGKVPPKPLRVIVIPYDKNGKRLLGTVGHGGVAPKSGHHLAITATTLASGHSPSQVAKVLVIAEEVPLGSGGIKFCKTLSYSLGGTPSQP